MIEVQLGDAQLSIIKHALRLALATPLSVKKGNMQPVTEIVRVRRALTYCIRNFEVAPNITQNEWTNTLLAKQENARAALVIVEEILENLGLLENLNEANIQISEEIMQVLYDALKQYRQCPAHRHQKAQGVLLRAQYLNVFNMKDLCDIEALLIDIKKSTASLLDLTASEMSIDIRRQQRAEVDMALTLVSNVMSVLGTQ